MKSLKLFLTSNKTAVECGVTQHELNLIKGYKTITVNGETYNTDDILHQLDLCDNCSRLKVKVKALQLELEKHNAPDPVPVQTLMSMLSFP